MNPGHNAHLDDLKARCTHCARVQTSSCRAGRIDFLTDVVDENAVMDVCDTGPVCSKHTKDMWQLYSQASSLGS